LVERLDKNTEEGKFNLRDQALKDLVSFYAEAESVDDAMSFFTEMQSKEKALSNLRLIADILRTKAKDEAAIKAYTKLIEEFPEGLDTPNLYLGLYESEARLGKSAASNKTLMTALDKFGENSDWAKSIPEENPFCSRLNSPLSKSKKLLPQKKCPMVPSSIPYNLSSSIS
jgi:tetratricopeptide (TPR) repeat protein